MKKALKFISAIITIYGIFIFIFGHHIEGLLAMILGELVDMEKEK